MTQQLADKFFLGEIKLAKEKDLYKRMGDFLNNEVLKSKISQYIFFLCRHDGVILYCKNGPKVALEEASLGALVGGVWQAADALTAFVPSNQEKDEFRLSFDTSSEGIYVLPAGFKDQEYYLGLIYYGEINPGMVKAKLRDLQKSFNQYVSSLEKKMVKDCNKKDGYLFQNITDNEMDELFAFSGI